MNLADEVTNLNKQYQHACEEKRWRLAAVIKAILADLEGTEEEHDQIA